MAGPSWWTPDIYKLLSEGKKKEIEMKQKPKPTQPVSYLFGYRGPYNPYKGTVSSPVRYSQNRGYRSLAAYRQSAKPAAPSWWRDYLAEKQQIDAANREAAGIGVPAQPPATSGRFSGHVEAQRPLTNQFGREIKAIPQAILERIYGSEPSPTFQFDPNSVPAGEEFANYMLESGVMLPLGHVPGGTMSGEWGSYILSRLGLYDYGINPFAVPPPPQQPEGVQVAYGGGGGYGGGYPVYVGGGGGGGKYKKEAPKQYGNVRNTAERNIPQWLMDMVTWSI